mgnify:CR=1 FL=1
MINSYKAGEKMPGKGWISLHRKIQDHWIWQDKPFSKGQAWIDILLMVNHKEQKVLFNNQVITVEEGEKITSIRQLCDRWGWSNTKVNNFLDLLQKEEMITYKSDTKKTVIKVLNYNDYQQLRKVKNDTKTTGKHHENDARTTQKHTNNNDNNDNNDNNNNIYSPATQDDTSEKVPYKEIIDYLNMRTGSQYRHTTKKTRELIRSRWNEGFNLNDFKTVIDKKCVEWMGDAKMEKYLRPVTLFGTKFESYLNQLSVEIKKDKYQKQHDTLRALYQEFKEEEDRHSNFKRSEYR